LVVVKPADVQLSFSKEILQSQKLLIVSQDKEGLTAAVNFGLQFIQDCDFWNWCGDDDFISDTGMTELVNCLAGSPKSYWGSGLASLRFEGLNFRLTSRLSGAKLTLQKFGPNLVAQPPLLFDLPFTLELGGLDERFSLAFDQDLIQKFNKKSPPVLVDCVTGTYNWHPGTLSNSFRKQSQSESLKVRLSHAESIQSRVLILILFPISTGVIRLANYGLLLLHRIAKCLDNSK
jgi:hypothetical protein